ncbi:MAG TPA: sugar phosphate isomerase/epimerase family protein [Bryobacteraceae bacterium]|nr:sugar phosphate isomerase/epimerase family protein [Bryobacteraceae bacterium]
MNRRAFLLASAASMLRGASGSHLKIGITDWNLEMTGRVEAVAMAKRLGFDGVQISLGRKLVDDQLPLDNPQLIAQYRAASKREGIPIDSTCLDRLHDDCLKSSGAAPKWVADGIRITAALGVRVMLLPLFFKCDVAPSEFDYVGSVLRELAPDAEKAGVVLGLEDQLSAEDNVRIMELSKSDAAKVYYDVGNSTRWNHDVLREIAWLGRDRICQFHFKDNPHYLGEGNIDFAKVLAAIRAIGFDGFANLETDAPSHSVEADLRRNLAFIRGLLG